MCVRRSVGSGKAMPLQGDGDQTAWLTAEVERWKGKVYEEREKWMRILDEKEQDWQIERDELTARAMREPTPAAPPAAKSPVESIDHGGDTPGAPSSDLMRMALMGGALSTATPPHLQGALQAGPSPPQAAAEQPPADSAPAVEVEVPAPVSPPPAADPAAPYALYEKKEGPATLVTAVVDLPGGRRDTTITIEPSVRVRVTSTADGAGSLAALYGTRMDCGARALRSEQADVDTEFDVRGVEEARAPRVIIDNGVLALQWRRTAPHVTSVGNGAAAPAAPANNGTAASGDEGACASSTRPCE
eukprot:TRINITY_DN9698_c0_g1_i1.p1 TRINITY_DN9698_c0_g1~~TRINITY_DN9698_c0_g1_i1.p1  ORF type:complete len:303 (+),score=85.55 TRINITY_DN9698_c0_g1_i1:116-1024(+)